VATWQNFGEAIDAQDGITVQRSQVKIVLLALMLLTASVSGSAGQGAVVSGVVRDSQGVVQMGALVQVLAGDSSIMRTAFTDLHGRYLIANVLPGKYQVRASAALFVPALRGNLQLRPGAQAIVNLTLNTLFDTAAWLPAERRKADEPSDDWKWTLRSTANRPILRLVDDENNMVVISSSLAESTAAKPSERVRGAVTTGDGGFGGSGVHNVLTLDRVLDDGAGMTLRAELGSTHGPLTGGPSTEIATGYERRTALGGASRAVVSYQSHPEIVGSGGTPGLETVQLASAQKMQFGDSVDVELGSTVYVVRAAGFTAASQPFFKVTAHPSSEWTVGYRMATSRNLQSFAGLDTVQMELPVAVMSKGHMQTERGRHHEFSVGRKVGPGVIQLGYYLDSLDRVLVAGGGGLGQADIQQAAAPDANGIVADAMTGSFRLLNAGYSTRGVNVMLTEPLTPNLWVALEYSTGAALAAKEGNAMALSSVATDLTPQTAQSATVAVKGRVVHTGTRVRAAYRWQPTRLVTAVDPYAAFSDQAYFSCYLRQAIRLGSLLPHGLEATVDVTNLLAQGYRPILSADGRTLFLAQSPRTVQAGLAFTF